MIVFQTKIKQIGDVGERKLYIVQKGRIKLNFQQKFRSYMIEKKVKKLNMFNFLIKF